MIVSGERKLLTHQSAFCWERCGSKRPFSNLLDSSNVIACLIISVLILPSYHIRLCRVGFGSVSKCLAVGWGSKKQLEGEFDKDRDYLPGSMKNADAVTTGCLRTVAKFQREERKRQAAEEACHELVDQIMSNLLDQLNTDLEKDAAQTVHRLAVDVDECWGELSDTEQKKFEAAGLSQDEAFDVVQKKLEAYGYTLELQGGRLVTVVWSEDI